MTTADKPIAKQVAFGQRLKDARLTHDMSLKDFAYATRIPETVLTDLEAGRWSRLPAAVFVKGYVRNYATRFGLDEHVLFLAYDQACRVEAVVRESPATAATNTSSSHSLASPARLGVALFVILLLIIATLTVSLIWQRGVGSASQASNVVRVSSLVPNAHT